MKNLRFTTFGKRVNCEHPARLRRPGSNINDLFQNHFSAVIADTAHLDKDMILGCMIAEEMQPQRKKKKKCSQCGSNHHAQQADCQEELKVLRIQVSSA